MNLIFVGIGLFMVAFATGLGAVGHHDGVIGADHPDDFLVQDGAGTFRVEVTGTPADVERTFSAYREELLLPEEMRQEMETVRFVPIKIEGTERSVEAYMRVAGDVPELGKTYVVTGEIRTEWPLYDTGSATLESLPILFIRPESYHEPLVFKR